MQRVYRRFVASSGIAIALLGVAMIVVTLGRGGGPLAFGVLLGVAFTAVGAGRAWLAARGHA